MSPLIYRVLFSVSEEDTDHPDTGTASASHPQEWITEPPETTDIVYCTHWPHLRPGQNMTTDIAPAPRHIHLCWHRPVLPCYSWPHQLVRRQVHCSWHTTVAPVLGNFSPVDLLRTFLILSISFFFHNSLGKQTHWLQSQMLKLNRRPSWLVIKLNFLLVTGIFSWSHVARSNVSIQLSDPARPPLLCPVPPPPSLSSARGDCIDCNSGSDWSVADNTAVPLADQFLLL